MTGSTSQHGWSMGSLQLSQGVPRRRFRSIRVAAFLLDQTMLQRLHCLFDVSRMVDPHRLHSRPSYTSGFARFVMRWNLSEVQMTPNGQVLQPTAVTARVE